MEDYNLKDIVKRVFISKFTTVIGVFTLQKQSEIIGQKIQVVI